MAYCLIDLLVALITIVTPLFIPTPSHCKTGDDSIGFSVVRNKKNLSVVLFESHESGKL